MKKRRPIQYRSTIGKAGVRYAAFVFPSSETTIAERLAADHASLPEVQDQAAAAGEGFAKGLEEFGHGTTVWPDPDLSTVRRSVQGERGAPVDNFLWYVLGERSEFVV